MRRSHGSATTWRPHANGRPLPRRSTCVIDDRVRTGGDQMKTDVARGTMHGTIFYGWAVVAGAFVVMLMGFGAAYSFGAFFHSLRDEFGATRREISLIFALTACIYFGLGAV